MKTSFFFSSIYFHIYLLTIFLDTVMDNYTPLWFRLVQTDSYQHYNMCAVTLFDKLCLLVIIS